MGTRRIASLVVVGCLWLPASAWAQTSLTGVARDTSGAVLPGRASGNLSDRSQTRFAIHGAPHAQPVIDGMNTEMAASNTGVFVWSAVNFQEVVAETSGIDADSDTGGMQLNMNPRDGGNLFSGTANTMFEPRLTQVDMRVSRLFRLPGTTRVRGSLDIHNIFNASSVLAMTPTYGAAWLNAAQVLSARLLRVSAQLDF